MPGGHRLFLPGGGDHSGVGICMSRSLLSYISNISFQAVGAHIWPRPEDVEEVHPTLQLLLADVRREGRTPLLGGDFNACIGPAEDRDYIDLVGPCGMGSRNQRGTDLIH